MATNALIPFKRFLHHGMRGRDVKAVKIALKRAGYGHGIYMSRVFGPHMAVNLRAFQKHMGLPADGIYGPSTHKKLSHHFSPYARWLYTHQKVPPVVPGTAAAAAQRCLVLAKEGKLRDDRGTVLPQIEATAKGSPVKNALGEDIFIHHEVMQVLVWLIDVKGFKEIGSFALCSDHHFDSEAGHAGGRAVDISTIDGMSVNQSGVYKDLLILLHDLQTGTLKPWQLISGGYAGHEDWACESLCIPSASFYGEPTLSEHSNHVHVGY
jgi:hypothetical protein